MADPATPPFLPESSLGIRVLRRRRRPFFSSSPNECNSYTGAGATYLDFGQEGEKSLGTNLALAFERSQKLDPENP